MSALALCAAANLVRDRGARRSRQSVVWAELPDLFRRAADFVDKILRGAQTRQTCAARYSTRDNRFRRIIRSIALVQSYRGEGGARPQMAGLSLIERTLWKGLGRPWALLIEEAADVCFRSSRRSNYFLRISRNSVGPFRRRRFLLMRSSGGASLSTSGSISRAAIRNALAAWLRWLAGLKLASPASISRRTASERLGLSG